MEMTYIGVIAFLTFVFSTITKNFVIDTRIMPFVNLGIGAVSAGLCFWIGILPCDGASNIFMGIVSCIISALGAGGFYDVIASYKKVERPIDEFNEDVVEHEIRGEG